MSKAREDERADQIDRERADPCDREREGLGHDRRKELASRGRQRIVDCALAFAGGLSVRGPNALKEARHRHVEGGGDIEQQRQFVNTWLVFTPRLKHKAALLSARNDVFANIAIITAGLITLIWPSIWPDLAVGVGIAVINADAAREVLEAARRERANARP